jgi:hypothetical protein
MFVGEIMYYFIHNALPHSVQFYLQIEWNLLSKEENEICSHKENQLKECTQGYELLCQ